MEDGTNTVGDDIQMTGMLVDHNASGHTGTVVGERIYVEVVPGRSALFLSKLPVLIIRADQRQRMLQSQAMFPAGPTLRYGSSRSMKPLSAHLHPPNFDHSRHLLRGHNKTAGLVGEKYFKSNRVNKLI